MAALLNPLQTEDWRQLLSWGRVNLGLGMRLVGTSVSRAKRPYRPEMLIHLLNEVERELRGHDRVFAANLVRVAASAVAADVERPPDEAGPPQRPWLM